MQDTSTYTSTIFSPPEDYDSMLARQEREAAEQKAFGELVDRQRREDIERCKIERYKEKLRDKEMRSRLKAAHTRANRPSTAQFKPIPADEFAAGPDPVWLVKGVLPMAELGVIFGASGSGKSFFAFDLVAAVALGEPWNGRRTNKTKVIYVAAEGQGGFRSRIRAYQIQKGIEMFGDQLQVIGAAPDMLSKSESEALVEIVRGSKAGIVVIDTLAQSMPGGDENSAVDVGKALKVCREIHEKSGALVLLIHHAGKDASRGARGWSGLRAAADVEIEVSKSPAQHVARVTKMKDGPDDAVFGFRLLPICVGVDRDGDVVTSCIVETTEFVTTPLPVRRGATQRAIFDALPIEGSALPGDVVDQAAEALPFDPEKTKRDRRREHAQAALRELIAQGEIVEIDGRVQLANLCKFNGNSPGDLC